MKQVLLIDGSLIFREFIKEKLTQEQISVDITTGKRDAWTKLITSLPDLVIMDIESDVGEIEEFLIQKQNDPNARRIPIVLCGPAIEHSKAAHLVQFGVVKYFTKPIKFDVLFAAIGRILKQTFSIDETPCVLDVHLNGDIIFVEVSQGLNREKLGILKYKLPEIIDANSIKDPKLILMLTSTELSFVDAFNLESLMDNITSDPRIQPKNIKVLTLDPFAKELIAGHQEYQGIETVDNLVEVLNTLVDSGPVTDIPDLVAEKILVNDDEASLGSVETRFQADSGSDYSEDNIMMKVAIVDDDSVIRSIMQSAFSAVGADCHIYNSGIEFMKEVNQQNFDVIILDIYIPDMNGFDILQTLHRNSFKTPIIIYSQATQREAVIQALSLGAKSYVVKPQKPEVLIKKALELMHS